MWQRGEGLSWNPELTDWDSSVLPTDISCHDRYLIPPSSVGLAWMKLMHCALEVRTLWSLPRTQGKVLGAVLFVNNVYFSTSSLIPCRVSDQTLAKVSPGPEELCAPLWKRQKQSQDHIVAANMLTHTPSFLSTIWDGNFPIRIFPTSLRNLDLSPWRRPGFFLFQLLDKQVAFESLIWMALI